MKYLVLVLVAAMFCGGCLSTQKREALEAKGEEIKAAIQSDLDFIKEVKAQMESGEISVSDGLAYINEAMARIKEAKAKAADIDAILEDEPWYNKAEAWLRLLLQLGALVATGGGAVVATNKIRDKKHENGVWDA